MPLLGVKRRDSGGGHSAIRWWCAHCSSECREAPSGSGAAACWPGRDHCRRRHRRSSHHRAQPDAIAAVQPVAPYWGEHTLLLLYCCCGDDHRNGSAAIGTDCHRPAGCQRHRARTRGQRRRTDGSSSSELEHSANLPGSVARTAACVPACPENRGINYKKDPPRRVCGAGAAGGHPVLRRGFVLLESPVDAEQPQQFEQDRVRRCVCRALPLWRTRPRVPSCSDRPRPLRACCLPPMAVARAVGRRCRGCHERAA